MAVSTGEAEGHTAPGEGLIWTQDRCSPKVILLTPHQAGPRPVLSSQEDSSQGSAGESFQQTRDGETVPLEARAHRGGW